MATALYDKIGSEYNETRRADEFLAERFRQFLVTAKGKSYLDIGCGTGNYTCALAGADFTFCGIDPSDLMLTKAIQRCSHVSWCKGEAENLPFENNFFDGIMASLTIHHWKNPEQSFAEIFRVIKPKSPFVLFTSLPEQIRSYWLNHYFPSMIRDSARQMPSFTEIDRAFQEAGLFIEKTENYFVRDDLQDYFLYCGKNRPQLYLREDVRSGISSFSSLANTSEIEKGLKNLAYDIEKGKVSRVIEDYQNDKGDYVFIIARKF